MTPIRKHRTFAEREQAARDRVKAEPVDFNAVPPSQWPMHDRLLNWARWSRGSSRSEGQAGTPMFELYRSSDARREYGMAVSLPVDQRDATRVQVGVSALPVKHRKAVQWHYLRGGRQARDTSRTLAVSLQGLADLVRDGRQMLMNRKT